MEKKQKELEEFSASAKICDLTATGNIQQVYEKDSTLSLMGKLDFIAKKCLGGVLIWSVRA